MMRRSVAAEVPDRLSRWRCGCCRWLCAAQDFDTKAKFAILMDYESGTVLFQKDADLPMEPASMAKLMTVAVVFNDIARRPPVS